MTRTEPTEYNAAAIGTEARSQLAELVHNARAIGGLSRTELMTSLFGTAVTGSNLQADLQDGSHERRLVTPLTRSSLFIGRSLKEFVPLVIHAIVVIVIMIPFGFRPDLGGGVLGLLLLSILGIGIGSLSYALAIAVREDDWMFWTVHQTLLFPLIILSGMLLPLDDGPGWMCVLAQFNPLTQVVDAERDLFAGHTATANVAYGFIAATATPSSASTWDSASCETAPADRLAPINVDG